MLVMALMELPMNKFLAFASQKVAVLVDNENFLAWKQHVLLVVKIHHLQMFLEETIPIPPRMAIVTPPTWPRSLD
ncbi:hypothetical protein PVK06_011928 [Gossypium arboreum]|uniref:Retrotransposon Copia-like N-terminal domain-containing protein n=1 Tax=Gossypium arboreum TaxID=29729 RepID=A0ABR0QA61_GOSAR|nr:hypothetical protein PVK06_011928 [Gossypium arboreum]